jgi:hypothetical protein
MATYKEISGFNIKSLATDPSNLLEGEIWYNSTSGTLKVSPLVGSWASGGALNTGRNYLAGFGTPTTAVAASGHISDVTTAVEEYDGTNWTTVTGVGTARYSLAGCGTLTAGLIAGGGPGYKTNTEEYDGTNWTTGGVLNTGRFELSAFGVQTAAVCAGGSTPGGTKSALTEEYNGSSWTTSPGSMNTARHALSAGGAGTLTAGIIYGGNDGLPPAPAATAVTETYDGSTWTNGASMTTARMANFSALQGTQTAALTGSGGAGTGAPNLTSVEGYNGTAWSTLTSVATTHKQAGGVGTNTTAMVFGGGPGNITATEQYSEAITAETITTS